MALGASLFEWPGEEVALTEQDLREAIEAKHGPADAPIPGTVNDYRVEWQRRFMRVSDSRGDWLWIALEEARATQLVFGVGVPGSGVELTAEGLRIECGASQARTFPPAPDRVRVATPDGVEERALKGSPHEIARGIFEGTERRPLRELLDAVTQPR